MKGPNIAIDCHFIQEKIVFGDIKTKFVNLNDELADIFTKSLCRPRIDYIYNKLGYILFICTSLRGSVECNKLSP